VNDAGATPTPRWLRWDAPLRRAGWGRVHDEGSADERICEGLHDCLTIRRLDRHACTIRVADGVVTLIGDIDNAGDKVRIEQVAGSIPGVQRVESRLRLVCSGGRSRDTAEASDDEDHDESIR
jgi:hypothetical protein